MINVGMIRFTFASAKDGLPEANTYADANAGQTYKYVSNGTLTSETDRDGLTTIYTYYENSSTVNDNQGTVL